MTRVFAIVGLLAYVLAAAVPALDLPSAYRLPLFQVAASAFALALVLGRIARRRVA